MPSARVIRPTSSTVIARRRAVASTALAGCLLADVLGVATAANRDDTEHGAELATVGAVSVEVGTRAPRATATAPAGSANSAETGSVTAPTASSANAGASRPAGPLTPAPVAPARVVERGTGQFTVLLVPAGSVKETPVKGREVRYTVEAEGGLGVDTTAYAGAVVENLTDARGWQTRDHVRFVNVTPAQAAAGTKPDLRITLASPDTTDRLCAPLKTRGQVSCHNGIRVVLNARRWLLGADAYGKDVTGYRIYLVNHEVGHGIGHGHQQCGGKGQPAPVMMQQTYGLDGCAVWPWPTSKPA